MLPGEIVFNILTRLPAELVLECKLVSKSWNKVVSYPSFSQTHLDRCLEDLDSGGKSTFLLVNDDFVYSSFSYRKFHYLEYHDDSSSENPPFYRVKRMKINPAPYMYYYLAGACNGLICLNGCPDNDWVNYEPVYICNPITRECVYLPVFERTPGLLAHSHGDRLLSGFGSTNEYKVVRMFNLLGEPNFLQVEVYTLGSGKGWRNLQKKFNKKLDSFKCVRGVFVNESLYWNLKTGKCNVVAFDLANEIFVEIPEAFPTSSDYIFGPLGGSDYILRVLGGYLSAVRYDNYWKTSELLLLKKKEEDGSLSWIKEFALSNTDTHQSLALSCRGTVLCHSGTKVQIHDLNSLSSKLLVDFGKERYIYETIPHMNTLVSLKALGEETTKTMETVDVPRDVDEEYKELPRNASAGTYI